MLRAVLEAFFKKPSTENYPFVKREQPKKLRGLLKFDASKCIGCKICMKDCPSNAITIKTVGEKKYIAEVDLNKCLFCGQCVDSCPKKALSETNEFELAQLDPKKLHITLDEQPQAKPSSDTK